MPTSLVALGSNLGDRREMLCRAVEQIALLAHSRLVACSKWRETFPIGGPKGQPNFLNGVASLETSLSPRQLLDRLEAIENSLGRTREVRWSARTIDLDLLLYGDVVVNSREIIVPHPRMALRRFVLEGAVEVAPDWVHPTLGKSLRELLEHLDTALPYVALLGPPQSGKTVLAARLAAAFGGRILADAAAARSDDPTSRDLGRQLQFLDRRLALLARDGWRADGPWTISDFYFDQCLAYAELALDEPRFAKFVESWQSVRPSITEPKLLVVLDEPPCESERAATSSIKYPIEARPQHLRLALTSLASRPGVGPALHVGNSDRETQFEEIRAAMQAMN